MVSIPSTNNVEACRDVIVEAVFGPGKSALWDQMEAKQALAQVLCIGFAVGLPGDVVANGNRIGRAVAETVNRVCDEIRAEHSKQGRPQP